MENDRLITARTAAAMYELHVDTFKRKADKGELPQKVPHPPGQDPRWSLREIQADIARRCRREQREAVA